MEMTVFLNVCIRALDEVDAESDIRRTSSLSLAVQNKDQMALDFENTWNKRMVEL